MPGVRLQLTEPVAIAPVVDAARISSAGAAPPLSHFANLAEAFWCAAEHRAEHAALVTERGHYRYAAVRQAAEAVAAGLASRADFRPGDRVALLAESSSGYLAGFYGILRAGGVVVPLPAEIETDRLQSIVARAGADIVLTAGRLRPRLIESLGQPAETIDLSAAAGVALPAPIAQRDQLAALLPTSGSTGEAKLVMLSHGNLLANAATIIEYLGIVPSDRALALLPFPHAFGNSVLQSHLLCGATLVQAGSFVFCNTVVEALAEYGITSFSGVPEMFRALLARSDLGQTPLPALRYMAVAGGGLPPDTAAALAARIAPAKLFVMYGQTEATARISYLPPADLTTRPGSIGRGLPDTTLEVHDAAGRSLPPGEVGELVARGPGVMQGYWGDSSGTAAALRDGWLHTGDLATHDADGYVYLRGRASELLKISGHRVHPAEIEAMITRRLPVENVVVVGCEAAAMDTRLAMYVQPARADGSLSVEGVLALCRDELPRHKVPSHVEILPRLPLTSAMKVDRAALRQRAAAWAAEAAQPG